MGSTEIPADAPFVVDEDRLAVDSAGNPAAKSYPTIGSVLRGFEIIGKSEMADAIVKFPRGGQVFEGPFAEMTAQHCPIEHVANGWPTVFQNYVAMIEHFQGKDETRGV